MPEQANPLKKIKDSITRYGTGSSGISNYKPMSTQIESPSYDLSIFQNKLPKIYKSTLAEFKKGLLGLILLHTFFILLIGMDLVLFITFIHSFSLAALGLGVIFLSCFCYAVLHFYSEARKPEKLELLKIRFITECKTLLCLPEGISQHHLTIAEAGLQLAAYLTDFEKSFFILPQSFSAIQPIIQKILSCFRKDANYFKNLLFQSAIEEHLKQIRETPTDLEVHASLAAAYVAESKMFRQAMNTGVKGSEERFRTAANCAMEEFRILDAYAPNDPWVHEQLAQGYNDLEMPKEELAELEILTRLRPNDTDILLRLGSLYFFMGMNAKGLQVYEHLRHSHVRKADALINMYGLRDRSLH